MLKRLIPENLHSFYALVASSLVFYAISYLLSFIGSIFVTRQLGPEGRGLVTLVLSLGTIGAIMAQLGLGPTNKKKAAENKDLGGSLFLFTIVTCLLSSIIVMPLVFWFGRNAFSIENYHVFLLGIAFIPFYAIANISGEILVGMNRVRSYNIVFLIERIIYVSLILIAVAGKFLDPFSALVIFFLPLIIKIFMCGFFLRKQISFRKIDRVKKLDLHLPSMMMNYLSSLGFMLNYSLPPILLSHFAGLEEAGIFTGARIIIDTLIVLPTIYSSYAVNKMISEKNNAHYLRLKLSLNAGIILIMVMVAGFFYLIADVLIPLIYGPSFQDSAQCIKYMLPGIIFHAGFLMIHSEFLVEDKSHLILFLAGIFTLCTGALPFLISPQINAMVISQVYSLATLIIFLTALLLRYGLRYRHSRHPHKITPPLIDSQE